MTKNKQPAQLYILSFCELWERFGFYSIQAIILLYFILKLHMSDHRGQQSFAIFNGMLYLATIGGGWLASRTLEVRSSILIGAILFGLGYLTLAASSHYFLWGLCLVIAGNGFFKPNLSTLIGEHYTLTDPRRESGFTIFYMIINIGSLLPPLFIGIFSEHYGYSAGFLFAACGIGICLTTYLLSWRLLKTSQKKYSHKPLSKNIIFAIAFTAIAIFICHQALIHPVISNDLLAACLIPVVGFLIYTGYHLGNDQQPRFIACSILTLISIVFWAFYVQVFSSITLFATRHMQLHFFNLPIHATWIQSYNPLFILILSPIFSQLWSRLIKIKRNPTIPQKFTLGIFFTGIAFFILYLGIQLCSQKQHISPIIFISFALCITIGELLISPIGLSMITELCPDHLKSTMMGIWFFALSFGFSLGGHLSSLSDIPKYCTPAESLSIYQHAFFIESLLAIGFSALCWMLSPRIQSLILRAQP